MRPCTIVKPLALFLGALSVVAHSLPERRSESEINIRAPGGYKFSDPLTKPEDVDGNINKGVSDATIDATTASQQLDISTPSLLLPFSFTRIILTITRR